MTATEAATHSAAADARRAASRDEELRLSALAPTHHPRLGDRYRRDGLWRGETIWDAFAATAARMSGKTAVVEGDVRTSFEALARAAERLAAGLAARGVGAGDVVAVQLPNWRETLEVLLATARLGAVANPILPIYRQRELGFILPQAGGRVLFIPGRHRDTDHRELVRGLRPHLPALEHVVVVRDDPGPDALAYADVAGDDPPPLVHDASALALLMYTSGTTADAKGVLHSHDTLLAEARSLGPVHGFSAADTVLMPSPLTHVSGLIHALLIPAVFGTTAVLMERWEPGDALARIARERVT